MKIRMSNALPSWKRKSPRYVLRWTRSHRRDDGSYWTGIVYPEQILFPFEEHTSYTAAALLLAVDAITNVTTAGDLFTRAPSTTPASRDAS